MADLNRIGWISGAPSKRCMKRRLSTTSTALPTSSAASDAAKKLVNGMPCSCSVIQRVNRIRLKPKRKKIVGGITCFTCTSHQSKARRQIGAGASNVAGTDGVMADFQQFARGQARQARSILLYDQAASNATVVLDVAHPRRPS